MKIGIVGAGQVGATAAYSMMMRRVGSEITLVDRNADLAVAQARDILDATKDFLLGLRRRGLNRVEFVVAALHCEDRRAPALDAQRPASRGDCLSTVAAMAGRGVRRPLKTSRKAGTRCLLSSGRSVRYGATSAHPSSETSEG